MEASCLYTVYRIRHEIICALFYFININMSKTLQTIYYYSRVIIDNLAATYFISYKYYYLSISISKRHQKNVHLIKYLFHFIQEIFPFQFFSNMDAILQTNKDGDII